MTRAFSFSYILKAFLSVVPYFPVTLAVTLGTALLSVLLSALLVKQKFSSNKILNALSEAYIQTLRCIPSIVVLFIVYYGLPELLLFVFKVNVNFWPKILFVIIALSLIYSANLAEIFRSSILAVGSEQMEAALCTGMTQVQGFFRIILPQALLYALPNLGNSLISLFKEGTLAFTIGLIDLMGAGNLFIARNYGGYALETYIALALIYWFLTVLVERLFGFAEKKLLKGREIL